MIVGFYYHKEREEETKKSTLPPTEMLSYSNQNGLSQNGLSQNGYGPDSIFEVYGVAELDFLNLEA